MVEGMEDNELIKWTAISFLIAFSSIWGFFIYLMHCGLVKSTADYILKVGLPMAVIPTLTAFMILEVLGSKKYQRPRRLWIKRFLGKTFVTLGLLTLLFSLILTAESMNLLRNSTTIILSGTLIFLIWLGLVLLIVTKLKKTFHKLSEGTW